MACKNLIIGKKKYSVSLILGSLNHLCTFKEIFDFKLTVLKNDSNFDTYTECKEDLTEDEVKLLSAMFSRLILDSYSSHEIKGFIATMNTGNAFRWGYTKEQKKAFAPLFKYIVPYSSMVLYESTSNGGYIEEGSTGTRKVELTMFNFELNRIKEVAYELEAIKRTMEENVPVEVVQQSFEITEAAIREYLQQGN